MILHNPAEAITEAEVAIELLKEGNRRYVSGNLSNKTSFSKDREVLNKGQKPFAVIICCSDSRVAPEIFFDQKLGDLFVIRNAGNVIDTTALGSIEYAVEHLHSPLVVVCGHSKCGAVTAAYQGGHLPANIKSITDRIQPAIHKGGDLDKVIHHNVGIMVEIVKADEIIQHLGTKVIGAYYDINTGEVTWL